MRTVHDRLAAGSNRANEARSGAHAFLRECPDTSHVRMAGLPKSQPPPKRWGMHRKAEVVDAVRGGILNLDEALERYALSMEEYLSWQHAINLFGLPGLLESRTQEDRCNRARFTDH